LAGSLTCIETLFHARMAKLMSIWAFLEPNHLRLRV